MKIWKRNAIVAAVLVLVCAGIYLNWSHNHPDAAAQLRPSITRILLCKCTTTTVTEWQSASNAAR